MRVAPRLIESLLVLALIAGGTWLRWAHLGTPSLWYDEVVHVRTAEKPTAGEVWRAARDGAMPGTGNAGAVPLDYLALHAWLRTAPAPTPETLERHHRVPAFLFSVLALPLAWGVARGVAGPAAGTIALALLATSMPHVLYAAEARLFSLSVLAALVNAAAFVALVRAPSVARTAAFAVASVGYVLAALYGVFPVAAEHAVLAALAVRERRWAVLAAVGASALGAAAVVAGWVGTSALATVYARGAPAWLATWPTLRDTLLFFAGDGRALAVVFGVALVAAPFAAGRDRVARAVAIAALLSLCAVPAMVAIAHWKNYYYHPRHGFFLLPLVHLATAIVATRMVGAPRAPVATMLGGVALVLAATAPALSAYVADPIPFFRRTKTHRDLRALARAIAVRTPAQAPGERLLLLVERRRPGHLANPTLAFYLDAYGLSERVTLAGTGDPLSVLTKLPALCPTGCRGPFSVPVMQALGLRAPYDQAGPMWRFLGLRVSSWSPAWSGVAVVAWAPNVPATPPPGVVEIRFDGASLYELTTARR